jgi:ABC-type sugar transport system ATPase subunit
MNFLDGKVEGGRFRIGEAALPLPPLNSGMATSPAAVSGVRPQDLSLVASAGPNALTGRVSLVELLGSEKLIEVQISDRKRISVQVRADSQVGLGESVYIGFDAQSIHVFDKRTEQFLLADTVNA